jgi:hypothetical protein
LHHTNIVQVHGIGESDGLHFYVMQFIEGQSLAEFRARAGAASNAEWFRFVGQVGLQAGEALAYAHAQGVLHRDIKPSNLMVDSHQTVWITDFGLAKIEGAGNLTATGDMPGTVRYLAPERRRRAHGPGRGRHPCRDDPDGAHRRRPLTPAERWRRPTRARAGAG